MTALTMKIGKSSSGEPVISEKKKGNTVVIDEPGKPSHAVLCTNDTLAVTLDTTKWTNDGITEIKFYKSQANYGTDTFFAHWVSGTTEINKDGTKVFSVSETPTGGKVTTVTLTDTEARDSDDGDDDMYYKVMVGTKPLDPEVVNKSGTSTGKGGGWETSTSTG